MSIIADLHIHSRHSIATSKLLVPPHLEYWSRLKGIALLGTGDCIHPGWLAELREALEPGPGGFFQLKESARLPESRTLLKGESVAFMLTGEISTIYSHEGRVRKVHHLVLFPDFDGVLAVQARLAEIGNIESDGRPILGLDSRDLLEIVLEHGRGAQLIPAHIWTPWFSVLGSKSGFDRIDDCYRDLAGHITAVETGLSSDPPMNWACSFLDRQVLISNSDAHSPEKLGREATLFDTELTLDAVMAALRGGGGCRGTVEFFPQEGKYHHDGHRACGVAWDPLTTLEHGGRCPVCGRGVTRGVMYRVAELADRADIESAPGRREYRSITPFPELLAEVMGQKSSSSKRVMAEYGRLVRAVAPELILLLEAPLDAIARAGGELLAEGVRRLREGRVIARSGYDGEFGRIRVFTDEELAAAGGGLFAIHQPGGAVAVLPSVDFDIGAFQRLRAEGRDLPVSPNTASPGTMNAAQRCAIDHGEGPCLVIAGPGTGKTRVLTERILRLTGGGVAAPDSVLAVTFSVKAAAEIARRLDAAGMPTGVTACTFHALGLSILRAEAVLAGVTNDVRIVDGEETLAIIESLTGEGRRAASLARGIESLKQGLPVDQAIAALAIAYDERLRAMNALDLADLVDLPAKLLSMHPELAIRWQARYRWILVDEFQDVNPRQYQFLQLLSGGPSANLFVIGDPDQAIYGFRGADRRIMERLAADYPDLVTVTLDRSYRCPDPVMRAAGQVLGREQRTIGVPFDVAVRIHESPTDLAEADWIAASIERMMGGLRSFSRDSGMSDGDAAWEDVSLGDFCVLCRTALLFEPIMTAFRNHAIPFRAHSLRPDHLRREPQRAALRALRDCYYGGVGAPLSPDVAGDVRAMIATRDSVADVIKFIMVVMGAGADEIDLIYAVAEPFGRDYGAFFQYLAQRTGADEYDPRAQAVQLMTIHAAKGLEFRSVFIAGCEEGLIPFALFGGGDADFLSEEERILYVGITRTREQLFLSHARSRVLRGRSLSSARSRFLDRLENSLVIEEKRPAGAMRDDGGQLNLF